MAQHLTDQKIATMVQQLSVKGIALVAVIYMDTRFHEIENIKTAGGSDDQGILRRIIMRWRNSTGATVQKLADILKTSGIVDRKAIKKCLDVENFNKIEERQPGGDDDMDEWELARVAVKFNTRALERVILQLGNINQTEIDNIKYDNPDDGRFQLFEILVKWSRKTDNNRPILITALMNEKDADNEDIRKYVGELTSLPDSAPGKGNLTGETTSPKDGLTAAGGGDPPSERNIEANKDEKTGETSTATGGGGMSLPSHPKKQKTEETPKLSHDPEISPDTTDGGDDVVPYPMKSELPGYVLIFNNEIFKREEDRRVGTDKDVENLEKVFSQRRFKVVTANDLSAKDMTTKIKAFVKKDTFKSKKKEEFSQEKIKDFLKNIKRNEKREEILNKLKEEAFKKDYVTAQRRLSLIEERRKQIDKDMTPKQKECFTKEFGEENTKKVEEQKVEEQTVEFEDIKNIEDFLNETKEEKSSESVDLEKTDCFIVAFLSHGGNGYIIDKNGERINIDEMIDEFTSDHCKPLASKPKAFLIQACRGGDCDWQTDNEPNDEFKTDFTIVEDEAIPRCADMIVGYATTTGLVSFRKKFDGSTFIRNFCDVVKRRGDKMDVLTMTTEVNMLVAKSCPIVKDGKLLKPVKQMSEFSHSLRKTWKLPSMVKS